MDKIRLFLDEDVHAALSTILQKRGFDVVHAQEVDKKGSSDAEQIEYAFHEQRCLMSFNVKDYVFLHNHYVRHGQEHLGHHRIKTVPNRRNPATSIERPSALFQKIYEKSAAISTQIKQIDRHSMSLMGRKHNACVA